MSPVGLPRWEARGVLPESEIPAKPQDPVFFFDPWIQGNPVAKMKLEDVKLADVVCVTHEHDDHIGDSVALVKQTRAMLICSPEIGIYVHKKGMEEVRVRARKTVVGKWAPGESIEY